MRVNLTIFLMLLLLAVKADTLTLQQCYTLAEANYPNIKQKVLFDQQTALRLKNLTTKYFPQLSLGGQASYQSQTVTFPALPEPFTNFLNIHLPLDHEQAMFDLNQDIYDGGVTKANKQLESAQHEVNLQTVEVDIYSVRAKVNTYFFTALVLRANRAVLDSNAQLLQQRINQVSSSFRNGAVLESDVLKLQAQLMQTQESISDNETNQKAIADALTVLTGQHLTATTILVSPSASGELAQLAKERPEFKLFDLQQKQLAVNDLVTRVKNTPTLGVFAEAGIAHPNLYNFLDNKTHGYWDVGGKLYWNISGFYTTHREKEVNKLQGQLIDIQKANFQRNLDLAEVNDNSEIERLTKLIQRDDAIIDTYSKVLKMSGNQLDNGTITVTDYLIDLNAQSLAQLNKQLHSVQLEQARVNYLTDLGKSFSK